MRDTYRQLIIAPENIKKDCVYVWQVSIMDSEELLGACTSVLTVEEQQRAERLRPGRVKRQFVVGRGLLRMLLSQVLGGSPMHIRLEAGPYGKLFTLPDFSLSFNIAHSGDTVLIALRGGGAVGVDLECIESHVPVLEIARSAFHPNEVARVAVCLDPEERRQLFYRYWTRKEAVSKADGRGLSLPFDSFEVPSEGERNVPVIVLDAVTGSRKVYFLYDLPLGRDVSATVAVDSRKCEIILMVLPRR